MKKRVQIPITRIQEDLNTALQRQIYQPVNTKTNNEQAINMLIDHKLDKTELMFFIETRDEIEFMVEFPETRTYGNNEIKEHK